MTNVLKRHLLIRDISRESKQLFKKKLLLIKMQKRDERLNVLFVLDNLSVFLLTGGQIWE